MGVVGRFAPSPSGRMHLGNVFTALLAWCSVRAQNGTMLLRIEDLDPQRCRAEYVTQLKDDLHWLGLDWDIEQTPQSRRTDVYAARFSQLCARALVYPCYCSRADLHAASAPHASDGRLLYDRRCRNLTQEMREKMSKTPAWRLIVPEREFSFRDGLQGEFFENLAAECGDFIIRRADGVYAYQLAVVEDDAAGGVTEVVRGRDLLESTPRQLYLYELLGAPAPRFYHVPLLLAPDGRRLSKRERDLDMGALRAQYSAPQLIGGLAARCGLNPSAEPITAAELARIFTWDAVRGQDIMLD